MSRIGLLLFINAFPVVIVGALSFTNEIIEAGRQIGSGPEVLDMIWKANVIELM